MSLNDVPWSDVVQGGCGLVALYLAVQIRHVLSNHELRISALEGYRRRKARKRRR